MKRIISFDNDKPVYQEDVEAILEAGRAFPGAKVYTHVPWFSVEGQLFVLANSQEEAMEAFLEYNKKYMSREEIAEVKISDFVHKDTSSLKITEQKT